VRRRRQAASSCGIDHPVTHPHSPEAVRRKSARHLTGSTDNTSILSEGFQKGERGAKRSILPERRGEEGSARRSSSAQAAATVLGNNHRRELNELYERDHLSSQGFASRNRQHARGHVLISANSSDGAAEITTPALVDKCTIPRGPSGYTVTLCRFVMTSIRTIQVRTISSRQAALQLRLTHAIASR
jgi:hypothetical protein